ncbi:hypothetical protein ACRS6Y_08120 [Bacillus cytotoxicus]
MHDLVQVEKGWFKTYPASTYDGIEKVKSKIDYAKKQADINPRVWS